MIRRCVLCASADWVAVQLIEWVAPRSYSWTREDGVDVILVERWTYGERCRDRKACRRRVELAGQQWMVRDGMDPIVQVTDRERHPVLPVMDATILEAAGLVMFGAPHCLTCGRPVRLSDARRWPPAWWHCDVERRPNAWHRLALPPDPEPEGEP